MPPVMITIAGLKPSPSGAGWERFQVEPTPGGGLTHAEATIETPYGLAASAWRINGDAFEITITVPSNTQADISLPVADASTVTEDGRPLRDSPELTDVREAGGRVIFTAPAGTYRFLAPRLSPAGR